MLDNMIPLRVSDLQFSHVEIYHPTVNPSQFTSTKKNENVLDVPSVNTGNNTNNNNNSDELQYWFLSVLCLDSPLTIFAPTPGRSAFSFYQRPVESSLRQHQTSRFDDDDDDSEEDEDQRDDVELNCDEFPSIERTLSFDDWNDGDDYPTPSPRSPHVFRFDDWSRHDNVDDDDVNNSLYTSPSDNSDSNDRYKQPEIESLYNPESLPSGKSSFYANHHGSSTLAILPPSDSYIFQPIPEGSSSRLSASITAAPTMSIHTLDPISISEEDHQVIPKCRGIPRLGSDDENDMYHPATRTIHIDEISQCLSSPTNCYEPPIPPFIFVPREQKGWKRTISRSWNRVVAIGRNDTSVKKHAKKRFSRKGLRGEF